MLFRKIHHPATQYDKAHDVWYMIIKTDEELLRYADLDGEMMAQAYVALPTNLEKSHLTGTKERVINQVLQNAVAMAKPGEKVWPLQAINHFQNKKIMGMHKYIQSTGPIQVGQRGGWCGAESFLRSWPNAVVTEEVERPDMRFPSEVKAYETDLLYLENAERVGLDFSRAVDAAVGYDRNTWNLINRERLVISELKLKDTAWVAGMVGMAKTVAIETQMADPAQADSFMKMFSVMDRKTIYIRTGDEQGLRSHRFFPLCNDRHDIKFI